MLLLVWGMADSMWKFLCTPNCPRSLSGGLGQESKIEQSKKRWELGNGLLEANPEERASPYDIQKRRVLWRLNVWYERTMLVVGCRQGLGVFSFIFQPTLSPLYVCHKGRLRVSRPGAEPQRWNKHSPFAPSGSKARGARAASRPAGTGRKTSPGS